MYYAGLDLGQAQDFTAIAITERLNFPVGKCTRCNEPFNEVHHHVRHLERFQLGTSYPVIIERVGELMNSEQLRDKCTLAVDYTGVGRPIVDMLKQARLKLVPISISGGLQETQNDLGGWTVPKRDLVSKLQVLLQSRRLKFADGLPEVQTLVNELLKFQVKVTEAGNDIYGSWREGSHDDLVLALAVACWYSERYGVSGNPEARPIDKSPLEYFTSIL